MRRLFSSISTKKIFHVQISKELRSRRVSFFWENTCTVQTRIKRNGCWIHLHISNRWRIWRIQKIKNINTLDIEFITEPDIKRPKLSDAGNFYIICSPEKLKLRPRNSQILNLRLKLNLPGKIEAMIGLLPSFVTRKHYIKNSNWISNRRKDETIHIDILNKHFYNTIKIKKNQEIPYFF